MSLTVALTLTGMDLSQMQWSLNWTMVSRMVWQPKEVRSAGLTGAYGPVVRLPGA